MGCFKAYINGEISLGGDKSLSHRLILFSLINCGRILLKNLSGSFDVLTSLNAVKSLGVSVISKNGTFELCGCPEGALSGAEATIDCGNSGTTARLLCGILAGRKGVYKLVGDKSLSRRPMKRVIDPIRAMGGIISSNNGCLPITIAGSNVLRAIDFNNERCSAQVKSAVLLAGLRAVGTTSITEKYQSRNHTENLLSAFGAKIKAYEGEQYFCSAEGQKDYFNFNGSFSLPGDISSAAFFIAAASVLPFSKLVIKNSLLNRGRIAYLDVLRQMGAKIETNIKSTELNEPRGDITVRCGELRAVNIGQERVVSLIDELPALACAMAFAKGVSVVRGASELRVKESDRISCLIKAFKKLKIRCREFVDGFEIEGGYPIEGNSRCFISSCKDHRLAMAFIILGLLSNIDVRLDDYECIKTSCPEFFKIIKHGPIKFK